MPITTTYYNLILPAVGGDAAVWAAYTNQNWATVDTALNLLEVNKLTANLVNGLTYVRRNNEWLQIDVSGSFVGIGDAPVNGTPYVRQNSAWVGLSPIVDALIIAATASTVRRLAKDVSTLTRYTSDGPTPVVVFYHDATYSDVNNHALHCVVGGNFTSVLPELSGSLELTISIGVSVLYRGQILINDEVTGSRPFVLDFRLVGVTETSQKLIGSFHIADGDIESILQTVGFGGLVLGGGGGPARALGSCIYGTSAENMEGLGTKALTVEFAVLGGRIGSNLTRDFSILLKE